MQRGAARRAGKWVVFLATLLLYVVASATLTEARAHGAARRSRAQEPRSTVRQRDSQAAGAGRQQQARSTVRRRPSRAASTSQA